MRGKSVKFPIAFLFWATFLVETAAQERYRRLTLQDEFDGASGSAVDAAKRTGKPAAVGAIRNCNITRVQPGTHIWTGSPVIKAVKLAPPLKLNCRYGSCRYTSARLITKGKFERKYGKFEARIKVPRRQGM